MSVKMRPITQADKSIMAPRANVSRITSSPMIGLDKVSSMPNNVVSSTIFGRLPHNVPDEGDLVFEDRYTRVGYIDLVKPVLNQFLAGRAAPVWKRVLNLKQEDIVNIINVNTVYDMESGLVPLSSVGTEVFDPERYIFGAELLLYLLHQVNIDEVLKDALIEAFILPVMTRKEKQAYKDGEFNIGDIFEIPADHVLEALSGEIEGWFYDSFALDVSNSDFSSGIDEETGECRRDQVLEALGDAASNYYINGANQFGLIETLLTIKRDGVGALESQILNYVFVLPYGYRPTIDGRVDALTSQYNKLVNANGELQDILDRKDPTIFTVMNKYREVVFLVRNIFIGDDTIIRSQRLKDYKSISDTISGKEGLMRRRMQGARVDYSGRSVITCDPDMPIDMVGIPIKILEKCAEPAVIRALRKYKVSDADKGTFSWKNLSTFSTTSDAEKDGITYEEFVKMWFENDGKFDRYGVIGRQPTLFYLGIQGFRVVPVDGDAIILSPLVVMPFNADFDGDQMHFNFPTTERAMAEVRDNMSFKNNIYYPKNGEVTVVTRHEILYGLWVCKNKAYDKQGVHVSEQQLHSMMDDMDNSGSGGFMRMVYDAVCKQRLSVYDTVTTKFGDKPAGIVALEYAIYGGGNDRVDLSDPNYKVKAKDLTNRAMEYYGSNRSAFLSAINRMVKLGFSVAKIWPPNISVIVEQETMEYIRNLVNDFSERMLEREEYVNLGIEIESEFSSYFSSEWSKLEKHVVQYLSDHLGPDNGYVAMWKSGAKGDQSNIRQIFGLKGRVQKNDISTFNSIVSGSYSGELTGMEHFITAYGSHQGIADKVLATAMPGYLSRRLEHAASIMSITADDCGTDEGMEFTLEDVVPFIDESQISKFGVYPDRYASAEDKRAFWKKHETIAQFDAAVNFLAKVLVGRYIIMDDGSSVRVTDEVAAKHYIRAAWGEKTDGVIKMRSVLYCARPCCRYCYGTDLSSGKDLPDIGRAVGFIAAQAVGEPGTQMTMKNFQRGGVVSEANLTSSFDLINDYFELHDFSKKRRNKRGVISYDRISPVEGYVKEQYLGNGSKRILVTNTSDENDRNNLIPGTTKIVVHENTVLKEYVRVGDSFQKVQGDLNMREVLKYRGYDKAAIYLALTLYNIFSNQDVNFKHFETLIGGMTVTILVADANTDIMPYDIPYGKGSRMTAGSVLTLPEMRYGILNGAGIKTILGLKGLPKFKTDFFESILMENMDSYVPRAILMNPNDSMSNPITRTAFGLGIGIGTDMRGR